MKGITQKLSDLLGDAICTRPRYAWVKMIGRHNVLNPTGISSICIDRAHIVAEFEKSRELGYTSRELSILLMYYYSKFVNLPSCKLISGMIAEDIHDEIMILITRYHRLKWEPSKHKNPSNGIFNMFHMIRRQRQSLYLADPTLEKVVKKQREKMRAQFRNGLTSMCDTFDESLGHTVDITSWDNLYSPDPETLYLLSLHEKDPE